MAYSVSYTTRSPRNQEIEGLSYFFVSKEKFLDLIDKNEFLEHTCFIDNFYGTSKTYVNKLLDEGFNVILEIEAQGASQVLKKIHDKNTIISIFIMPPSYQKLEARIKSRNTETASVIEKRLNKAKEEFEFKQMYKFVETNDILSETVARITNIIQSNTSK